jgi:hypothetical protein
VKDHYAKLDFISSEKQKNVWFLGVTATIRGPI